MLANINHPSPCGPQPTWAIRKGREQKLVFNESQGMAAWKQRHVHHTIRRMKLTRPEDVDKSSRLWLVRTCDGHMIETIRLTHVQKSSFTLLTQWPWQTKKSSFAMMTLFFISPSIIRSPTGTFHLLDTRSVAQSSFLFLRHPSFLSLLHSPTHPQSFSSLPKSTCFL